MKNVLALDFSLANTGWAVFSPVELFDTKIHAPIARGTFRCPKQRKEKAEDLAFRSIEYYKYFDAMFDRYDPGIAIIERPYGSKNSDAAYAMGVCCSLIGYLRLRRQFTVCIVEPKNLKQWLGWKRGDNAKQISKNWCNRRFLAFDNDHEADAICAYAYWRDSQHTIMF